MTTHASLTAWKDTTAFLVCVVLCYFFPFAPLRLQRGAQYITQYTVICLWLKFLLSFEAHTGSVLKRSSSSGKNWKPFHLRGLKGSKEHQITLPVVFHFFFFPPQKLVTNCTFVRRGLCQAGAGGTALGFRLWRPWQLQNGVCFISPSDPRPKKSHAGKTERYTIHQGPVKLHSWEMRKPKTAEWAENEGAYCRRSFNTTIPIWGWIKVATLWEWGKRVCLSIVILLLHTCNQEIPRNGIALYLLCKYESEVVCHKLCI